MRPDTIQRLNQLNRSFYAEQAAEFDSTRRGAWTGFAQVLDQRRRRDPGPLSVLDLGCGNGRFGEYLFQRWPGPVRYAGVDQSAQLLAQARRRLKHWSGVSLRRADLIEGLQSDPGRHHLVAAFGLMHHVPGFTTRRRVLERALEAVSPGGELVVTFWQFADRKRFSRRIVPWSELGRHAEPDVDTDDLEPGDHLLRWGSGPTAVRYCHHASSTEVERLLSGLACPVVDRFRMDGAGGDLNRYVILSPT
ncbi:MAG: class I SAM-dependent methyltransferase [Deltaproteobacteria bacterium]|nr:class I SAM-dependent methyltransferase [Deltaproteobacteria bacterium]MBW2532318.1 class I SAM-dependent methyltransferase [Deltaproteobacteria bacterium]